MTTKQKYIVEVCRTSYSRLQPIEIDAESPEEAEALALDKAGNYSFDESESDYTAESCTRIN